MVWTGLKPLKQENRAQSHSIENADGVPTQRGDANMKLRALASRHLDPIPSSLIFHLIKVFSIKTSYWFNWKALILHAKTHGSRVALGIVTNTQKGMARVLQPLTWHNNTTTQQQQQQQRQQQQQQQQQQKPEYQVVPHLLELRKCSHLDQIHKLLYQT